MATIKNSVGWFEIPVADMDRAISFYEGVFGVKLDRNTLGPLDMAWFPMEEDAPNAAGSLVFHQDFYKPSSTDGVLIYFTSPSGDVANELDKVEQFGGRLLRSKTPIGEKFGFMGLFLDSEGNRIAMHSRS